MSFLPFISSFSLLVSFHRLFSNHYPSPKQNAWLITAFASLVMTLASLPFLYDFYLYGPTGVRPLPALSIPANRFFQAYLLSDLVVGVVHYPKQINLLTGWIHHIVYIGIVEYAIRMQWASVFCLCAFMELPTFLLSFSILIPRTRSNILFASTFFLTRILLHIVLGIAYFHTPEKRPVSYILAAVFPLHANWFIGCIRGFIRRARSSTTTSSSTAASTPVRTRLYRLRTPGRRQLAIEQLYLLRGHSDSIRQQLYLLRGGSLRRIGEYRQRMRDYRRAVVTRLDRQGVFDWVGLNATPTPTRG